MRHAIGCIVFSLVGLAWSGFVLFLMVFAYFGDCGGDDVCHQMQNAHAMHDLLYGLAGGALICLAYAAYRRFVEGKDV
ncbi:MAG: hypothetical protein V4499_09640 [Pseudomonadota bacterium]